MFYKPALQWAGVALAARLMFGLFIHIYSIQAGFEGFVPMSNYGDDILYWSLAEKMLLGYDTGYTINLYPMFLAALFQVTGQNMLIAKLVNLLLNVTAVYMTVLITRDVGQAAGLERRSVKVAGHLTGAMLALYPSHIFYAVQMIKDPFLIFAGTLNLFVAIQLLLGKGSKTWNLVGWGLSAIGVFTFRPYTLIALVGTWLVYLLFVWKTKFSRKAMVVGFVVGLVGVLPYFAGLGFFASTYIGPWLDVEKVSEFRTKGYSIGGSAADIALDFTNPLTFIQTYGFSVLTAMFGPFPWQLKSPIQFVALPDAIFTLLMTVALLIPLGRGRSKAQINAPGKNMPYILLIFSIILIGLIGLFSDNIGSNTRLRLLSWNIFYAFLSLVVAQRYFSGSRSGRKILTSLKRS
jgi:hypothetical protein